MVKHLNVSIDSLTCICIVLQQCDEQQQAANELRAALERLESRKNDTKAEVQETELGTKSLETIEHLNVQLKVANEKIEKLESELVSANGTVTGLQSQLTETEDIVCSLSDEQTKFEETIASLQAQLAEVEETKTGPTIELDEIRNSFENFESDLKVITRESNRVRTG